ncbi:hypothetical protein AB0C96_35050 [Streptomyces sp. NPDC048506]|uniref:hypothetical protein n=1 Tax=Streptomyces sp. NPDC048506 TaxID=3155028 RepID=UPI00342DEAD6
MSPSDSAAHPVKPGQVFDRETEWADLMGFACDPCPGATLGLVSGQQRQGKTFLLEAVAKAVGGFYFDGQAAAEAETLHRLAARFGEHTERRIHHAGGAGRMPWTPCWSWATSARSS